MDIFSKKDKKEMGSQTEKNEYAQLLKDLGFTVNFKSDQFKPKSRYKPPTATYHLPTYSNLDKRKPTGYNYKEPHHQSSKSQREYRYLLEKHGCDPNSKKVQSRKCQLLLRGEYVEKIPLNKKVKNIPIEKLDNDMDEFEKFYLLDPDQEYPADPDDVIEPWHGQELPFFGDGLFKRVPIIYKRYKKSGGRSINEFIKALQNNLKKQ